MSTEEPPAHSAFTSASRGGGINMPRLATASILATLALFAGLLTSVSAQTIDIATTIQRLATVSRSSIEQPIQTARSLPAEATITGPVTIELSFSEGVTAATLSMLTVTNATLSNWQNTSASRKWTFTLTPTADGAVEVTLPASSVQLAPGGFNRWNLAATYSATADLGAPTVVWRGFSSTKVRNNQFGPYNDGDQIDMTVTFSEQVTVTGAPYIRVRINTRDVQLAYQSGSGTATLVFRYTIPSGFPSTPRNPLVRSDSVEIPSGASIVDSGGAALTSMLPPQITLMTRSVPLLLAGQTDTGVAVGDQQDWVLTYDRPVTVTQAAGAAKAYLRIRGKKQDNSVASLQAVYAAGSGTRSLTFRYTVLATDMIASDSGFSLLANHVHTPNGFNIQDASGIDAATQQGSYSVLSTARERTRVQIPVVIGNSTPEARTYHFTSGVPERMTLNPTSLTIAGTTTDSNAWQQPRTLIATLHGDSDAERNTVALTYRVETENALLSGQSGIWRWLTVLDDDPEIDALTAARASIAEGENAEFELRLTEPPPSEGRMVHATVSERGDCLSSSLTDADEDAPGMQQEIELQTSADSGMGALSLPTVNDAIGEADCVVSVVLRPPDPSDPLSFALAGSETSLRQSVTVRDDDGGPPPVETPETDLPIANPTDDDLQPPQTRYPPDLEAQTIVEGQTASGEINITRSDRPQADVQFHHRFVPAGIVDGAPDPVTFIEHRWWERKTWTITARHDADSDDERVRWHLDAQSDDREWRNIYVHYAYITVRDDDPQVGAREALQESVTEGQTAMFRLTLAKPPLNASRSVRVTLTADGDVLAEGLSDADHNTPGIQLDLPLARTLDGDPTAMLWLATDDDDQDEPDAALTVSVAPPSDHATDNYFTLAGDAAEFTATISVLDNDEPEAPLEEETETPPETDDPSEGEELLDEEDTPETDDPSEGKELLDEEDTPETDDPAEGKDLLDEDDAPSDDDPAEGETPVATGDPAESEQPTEADEQRSDEDPPPSEDDEDPAEGNDPPKADDAEEGEVLVDFPNTGSGGLASPPARTHTLAFTAPSLRLCLPSYPPSPPSYPRLPRVSRLNSTAVTPHHLPVIPAHAGIQTQLRSQGEGPEAVTNARSQRIPVRFAADNRSMDSSVRWNDGKEGRE